MTVNMASAHETPLRVGFVIKTGMIDFSLATSYGFTGASAFQYPGNLPECSGRIPVGFENQRNIVRISDKPIYRKVIVPWYDSEAACLFVLVLMIPTLIFGIIGIDITRRSTEYGDYFWIPTGLTVLSSLVIISTLSRMIRRFIERAER